MFEFLVEKEIDKRTRYGIIQVKNCTKHLKKDTAKLTALYNEGYQVAENTISHFLNI